MATPDPTQTKPLLWVGRSKEDLARFPNPVKREAGYALYLAQIGMKAIKAKPLKGFGGAGVLEMIANHDGNTYRAVYAVYTVKFADVVYVLHAFQKKSKSGAATPKAEIEILKERLKTAADHYRRRLEEN
jgi:phage-related protein